MNTGFAGSSNISLTAGADVGFKPVFNLFPSAEVRGTFPLRKGEVASEKDLLGGLKLAKYYRNFHPYVDLLFGRTEVQYQTFPVTPDYSKYYVQSVAGLFSPGAGVDLQVSHRLCLKLDLQFGIYSSPVTSSGRAVNPSASLGFSYRFSFERKRK